VLQGQHVQGHVQQPTQLSKSKNAGWLKHCEPPVSAAFSVMYIVKQGNVQSLTLHISNHALIYLAMKSNYFAMTQALSCLQ